MSHSGSPESSKINISNICRGYLKRQVKQYLNSHINITPKAIILEVVFVNGGCDSRHMIPEPDEMSDAILSKTCSPSSCELELLCRSKSGARIL